MTIPNSSLNKNGDTTRIVQPGGEILTSHTNGSSRSSRNGVATKRISSSPPGLLSPSPSSSCMEASLSCTTFNILAPIYKRIGSEGCRESHFHDTWFNRTERIVEMLLQEASSIICLQEFWIENEEFVRLYEDRFGLAGYQTFKLARTSDRGDGLLTAIKSDRIRVLNYMALHFNDCGDRVAQFFQLQCKVPFYKRSQLGEQQLLLVNTHLLFPHNSSFCLVRLWQVYKIIERLERFKVEHGLASVPVIFCGDWNGSKRGHVYKFLCSQGFVSSYDSLHGTCDSDARRWVSHRNHRGDVCGVDFIWLRNPGKPQEPLSASWREAVLGIIKAKLLEADISGKDIVRYLQPKNAGCKLPVYELQRRLHQLGLRGKYSEGFFNEETRDLMQSLFVDASDLIDCTAAIKVALPVATSLSNESLALPSNPSTNLKNAWPASANISTALSGSRSISDKAASRLIIQDASLFPPEVESGFWPDDYVLSDHARLTAVFRPTREFD